MVPQGKALERALELAEMACQQSPSSIASCKQLVMHSRESSSHEQGWRLERELFVDLFDTQDQKEGVQAFLEKRTAQWKNR